jgi:NAD(P)-dependent dehydrogenase (short-subunit alcohol dehydrogenase family)
MAERRLALIVGATRGIGLGVTKEFLAHGWDVIATARHPQQAQALQELNTAHPGRVSIPQLDMNDPAMLDGFAASLGGKVLDAVLVNAGVSGPEHKSASKATADEIGALMFTNAIAPIRLARSLAGHARPGSGVLAFTTSIMGSVAVNPGGHELYRASKAALNSLTRGLWGELEGRKLTLVSLHPGWVRTDMGGQSAAVSVDDSAAGIVKVLEAQSGAHQHRFLSYTGEQLPW